MKWSPQRWMLVIPAAGLYLVLLAGPLVELASLSVQHGGLSDKVNSLTLSNYAALGAPGFVRVLLDTLRISAIATCASVGVGYLIAHWLARRCSNRVRFFTINLVVSMLFLSILIRIYAISLTFGPAGVMPGLTEIFGIRPTSRPVTECLIILGLVNFTMPLAILSLLVAVENINPRLMQAAQSLGAPYWKAFFAVDVALTLPSIASIAVIVFSLCISAFLIPLILGRGFVEFVANLVYIRFSEIYDFSGGAAMAVAMLLITSAIVYGMQRVIRAKT